ncbi:MAG: FHA domain-containing protein [Candidatus Limnocylindria bacterium]
MSVIEELLARIKALFGPNRPAPPTQTVEEPPAPQVVAAPEPPPAAFEPPLVEEAPALVAQGPTLVEAALTLVEEAPTLVEEAPTLVDEAPPDLAEAAGDIPSMLPPTPAGGLTLRLETERGPRSTFAVTRSGATIGRGPESTIQLADLSVSRKHARITYKQGAYWLSDLGSMGGTWIDGTKLAAPRRVATGQIIDIGLCRLSVISAGADEESPAAEGSSHAASGSGSSR